MKRFTVLSLSLLALAGSAWLGHAVWGQTTADSKERTFTITQSQLDKYVAGKVAEAVAAAQEKAPRDKPATDEQVLKPENWHKAIFNKAEYVIYTGPGQMVFHHWVMPAAKSGDATAPTGKQP